MTADLTPGQGLKHVYFGRSRSWTGTETSGLGARRNGHRSWTGIETLGVEAQGEKINIDPGQGLKLRIY